MLICASGTLVAFAGKDGGVINGVILWWKTILVQLTGIL
jgi:hypothetical protein